MINISVERVKASPIKLLKSGDKVIGCFYYGKYRKRDTWDDEIRGHLGCDLEESSNMGH